MESVRSKAKHSPFPELITVERHNASETPVECIELIVNVPLQICLYFNGYFTPFWFMSHVCSVILKYNHLSDIYQFLAITSLAILIVVEVPRLYFGYWGNLLEEIRQLLAFWLLTVLIQLPIHLYVQFDSSLLTLPLERIVDIVMLIFTMFEIIIGYFAIASVIRMKIFRYKTSSR